MKVSPFARARDRLRGLIWQTRGVLRRSAYERDLAEEQRFHVDMETDRLMREGLSAAEARRRAHVAYGGTDRWREATRSARWTWATEELAREVRHALRGLLRRPLFALIAIATLAIAIGASSALFSVVDAVLLRPLAVREPERLVNVWIERAQGERRYTVSLPDYLDYRAGAAGALDLAAHHVSDVTLGGGDGAANAQAALGTDVSGNYFRVLGVQPAIGRFFDGARADDIAAAPEVVLSHALWSSRFGADPAALGSTLHVNGQPLVVVGVTPADFNGAFLGAAPAVYLPLGLYGRLQNRAIEERMTTFWLQLLGRLGPESTIEQATVAMSTVARGLASTHDYPPVLEPAGAAVRRFSALPPGPRDAITRLTWILLAASGLLLVIAAVNIASMLLARAAARTREISVRLALGSGHARLARQLLVEGLVLGLAGGAVGVGIAAAGVGLLGRVTPPQARGFNLGLELNGAVLGFALVAALAASLVFGLLPALHASRRDLTPGMRPHAGARVSGRARSALLAGQVAMTLVLLVATALFGRTLRNAVTVDHGFEPEGIVVGELNLRLNGYDEPRGQQFYSDLLERLEASPHIASAALSSMIPLSGDWDQTRVLVPGVEAPDPSGWPVGMASVSEGYFETIGLPLLAGTVPALDAVPPQLVVNRAMATRLFGEEAPVGRGVTFAGRDAQVAGVVPDGRYQSLSDEGTLFAWVPRSLVYMSSANVLVRPSADLSAAVDALRATVANVDPYLPLIDVSTLESHMGQSMFLQRSAASLIGAFALVALVLSAAGIFGLLAYLVAQRRHEISVRMAIGASGVGIVRSVVGAGLRPVLGGLILGIGGALVVTRALSSLLFDVGVHDPFSFASAALVLVATAFIAAFLPARQATRVPPADALRVET